MYKIHILLTSALAGGVVSFTTRPLYPGERAPGIHWIGVWVDPRAGLDDVEKRKFLTLPGLKLDPSVVQPVVCRYTAYTIPAPLDAMGKIKISFPYGRPYPSCYTDRYPGSPSQLLNRNIISVVLDVAALNRTHSGSG
jgi:hypothetical protein